LQNFHDVKVFLFQENPFALEVLINGLFLLLDWFALSVDLLEEYLHKIYLTQSQLIQLLNQLYLLPSLLRWLNALDKTLCRHSRITCLLALSE